MLVWPLPFSPTYATGAVAVPRSPFDPGVLAGAALVVLLGAAVMRAPRFTSPAGVGAVWAGATYLLASNLVLPFSTLMSERFLYLPSLGLAMVAAPPLERLSREGLRRAGTSKLRRGVLAASIAAPIAALGVLTFARTPVFGDDVALMEAAYRWYPNGALARLARADRISVAGRYDEADEELRRLLADHPGLPLAEETLAQNAQARGDREAARGWWERAIRHPGAEVGTYHAYAEFLSREGQEPEVVRLLTEGIRTGRGSAITAARAREMRGSYLLRRGRPLQGLADLRLACALNPESVWVWEDLAAALIGTDPAGAESALRRAAELAPNRAATLHKLAGLLLSRKRGAEAVPYLERIIALDLGNLRARSDLGTALSQSGRLSEAEAVFEEILARDPAHPVALATLGSLRESEGRNEEAAGLYERFLAAAPADSPVIESVRARLRRLRGTP
jgi:tetratricopeptide (TPR) repeat protein